MNKLKNRFSICGTPRLREALAAIAILACQTVNAEDGNAAGVRPVKLLAKQVATLENIDILESSGLAASRQTPGLFWTHNDSGDGPRLFAFNTSGRDQGVVSLSGIQAVDWEDIASFRRDNRGWLLVADVGDNARRRETCQLHVLPEPTLRATAAKVHTTINFRYASGPRDCEAVGLDVSTNTALLVSKSILNTEVSAIKLLPTPNNEILVAHAIATISVPLATALDLSPDGTKAIVLTYADAYEFQRRRDESWASAFKRKPQVVKMPPRKQGESICYGPDGRCLYLTSERRPTPLWKVERMR